MTASPSGWQAETGQNMTFTLIRRANPRSATPFGGYRGKLATVKVHRATGRPISCEHRS